MAWWGLPATPPTLASSTLMAYGWNLSENLSNNLN